MHGAEFLSSNGAPRKVWRRQRTGRVFVTDFLAVIHRAALGNTVLLHAGREDTGEAESLGGYIIGGAFAARTRRTVSGADPERATRGDRGELALTIHAIIV